MWHIFKWSIVFYVRLFQSSYIKIEPQNWKVDYLVRINQILPVFHNKNLLITWIPTVSIGGPESHGGTER